MRAAAPEFGRAVERAVDVNEARKWVSAVFSLRAPKAIELRLRAGRGDGEGGPAKRALMHTVLKAAQICRAVQRAAYFG